MDAHKFDEQRYMPEDEIPHKCTHPKEYWADRTSHSEKNPGREFIGCERCGAFIRWKSDSNEQEARAPKRIRDECVDPALLFYIKRMTFAIDNIADTMEKMARNNARKDQSFFR